jgi:hypothetical protein
MPMLTSEWHAYKGTWIHLLAFAPAITVPLTSVYNNKIQTTGNTLDIALNNDGTLCTP